MIDTPRAIQKCTTTMLDVVRKCSSDLEASQQAIVRNLIEKNRCEGIAEVIHEQYMKERGF